MVKIVSATAAKNRLGALVESVGRGEGDVIVEKHGEPAVAIIPIRAYEQLERSRKEERRKNAAETLRRLRAEIQDQNPDLTEELANEIANQASNDVMAAIIAKNEVVLGR